MEYYVTIKDEEQFLETIKLIEEITKNRAKKVLFRPYRYGEQEGIVRYYLQDYDGVFNLSTDEYDWICLFLVNKDILGE